jgi:hypothetical protein
MNTIARRTFLIAGLMVLSGILLGLASMLLGFDNAEWAFVIVFWFGLILSIPALVAVLVTGPGAR